MIETNEKDCIIDPKIEKCNHNIKSRKTSIVILDSPRTFTYPEIFFGICKCCGKSFAFEKLDNGELKRIKNKGDN